MSVTDRDLGFLKAVTNVEKLAKCQVKIGIQTDSGSYPDGTSVLDVAIWNEYGTRHIPSRPFIRQCFALHSEQAFNLLKRSVLLVSNGMPPFTALSQVGLWYEGKMKSVLRTFAWQPNAPQTIKRKKSSKPLIDTGQLLYSIRYEVES
ncbi:hypothetical protein GVX76_08160 [[Haemophilus] felis]|nr:hypothetical protein [[Haemophilus] felis]